MGVVVKVNPFNSNKHLLEQNRTLKFGLVVGGSYY